MTVKISDLKFCNRAENLSPKYYVRDLDELNGKNVGGMVQLPADYPKGGKGSVKVVVAIDKKGRLMLGENDRAVMPCPPYCGPPPTKRMTLSAYLNQ